RVDHRLTPSDLLTARYYINDSDTYNSGTYGIPESDPLGDITDVRVQSVLGSYTHIFSPSFSNDLRFTYLRRKFIDSRPGAGENLASQIGLKGVTNAAVPAFTITGYVRASEVHRIAAGRRRVPCQSDRSQGCDERCFPGFHHSRLRDTR